MVTVTFYLVSLLLPWSFSVYSNLKSENDPFERYIECFHSSVEIPALVSISLREIPILKIAYQALQDLALTLSPLTLPGPRRSPWLVSWLFLE